MLELDNGPWETCWECCAQSESASGLKCDINTISVDMYTFEHWFTVEVVKVKKWVPFINIYRFIDY